MPSKTDFNVSPYFDDFSESKKFHRVMYRPAFAVQARELTTQQSILQNQIESFGDHMFAHGAMVIPGQISFDQNYFAVKLTSFNGTLSLYNANKITGGTSGATGTLTKKDLDLNQIDNMFIVSKPTEIVEAEEEQQQELKGDGGLLDFDGLDANAIEQDVLADTTEDLEYTELDFDLLAVDFLQDLLEIIEETNALDKGSSSSKDASLGIDKIEGTAIGLDPETQFNTLALDGKVFFFRQVTNTISIRQGSGTSARIELYDGNLKDTIICLNECEGTTIIIRQED